MPSEPKWEQVESRKCAHCGSKMTHLYRSPLNSISWTIVCEDCGELTKHCIGESLETQYVKPVVSPQQTATT